MILISLKELEKKEHHRHAHALLRECLKTYRIDYDENTPVNYGKMGKPSLAEHPGIFYNLSHADGIAACIVTDRECGIDCEKVRPHRPNVMKRAFSESERLLVENTAEELRDLMFFRIWTLKESFVKYIGQGISYPLASVSFSFEGNELICSEKNCSFRQYILKGGRYVVSVCTDKK